MPLVCEISGEPLLGNADSNGNNNNEIVVTPSGHICIKRLLLTKMAENGGLDPFETIRQLPLSEDQLVTLNSTSSTAASAAPPRPQATSLPNMLGLIQTEYDALVVELFDTRKALEETRRELSQALYQNDAAIRVVARVAQERDTTKQQLEQWNNSATAVSAANGTTNGGADAAGSPEEEVTVAAPPPPAAETSEDKEEQQQQQQQPSAKKRRRILEPTAEIVANDLPADDLQVMTDVWTQLSKVRKPTLKAAAAEAPTKETLAAYQFLEKKAWHKSTNRGIPCISGNSENLTVTAGKDKQLVVYNESEQVVQHTFNFGSVATCVDIGNALVVAGNAKGNIAVFAFNNEKDVTDEGAKGEIDVGSPIVDVRVHPTNQHIFAATADGRVIIAYWVAEEKRLQQISTFEVLEADSKEDYTSAALHPDGLIYVTGTKTGKLHVWDLKNKVLAATLQVSLFGRHIHYYYYCYC